MRDVVWLLRQTTTVLRLFGNYTLAGVVALCALAVMALTVMGVRL